MDSMKHYLWMCLAWICGLCQRKGLDTCCAQNTSQTLIIYTLIKQTRRKLPQPIELKGSIRGTAPEFWCFSSLKGSFSMLPFGLLGVFFLFD